VVDDLLGIIVIAGVYTESVHLLWLLAAFAVIAVFALLVRLRAFPGRGPVLFVLAVTTWAFMHTSGVHATIAGVALGLTAPALARHGESHSVAERLEHQWRPVSAGLAVPVFALFAAGVSLNGKVIADSLTDPVAQGVALGLVVGKPLGILAATWLVATFTRARLAEDLYWRDVAAVGALAGMGFTVSLLIGALAFGTGSPHDQHLTVAILFASLAAALLGGGSLAFRDRQHRRIAESHPA